MESDWAPALRAHEWQNDTDGGIVEDGSSHCFLPVVWDGVETAHSPVDYASCFDYWADVAHDAGHPVAFDDGLLGDREEWGWDLERCKECVEVFREERLSAPTSRCAVGLGGWI